MRNNTSCSLHDLKYKKTKINLLYESPHKGKDGMWQRFTKFTKETVHLILTVP